jgi:hypothetical protein
MMLDNETVQEIAKATGKTADLLRAAGGFLDDVLGKTLREFGGVLADWAAHFRLRNALAIAEKAQRLLDARGVKGKLLSVEPRFALSLLDAASLETEDEIQELWAALFANAADPHRALCLRKVFLEVLRGLEPVDARIMKFLADPTLDARYTVLTGATVNANVISAGIEVDIKNVKISLQTLARYQCVIDSWESTLQGLDRGYGGFRVDSSQSNFRLSNLGVELMRATGA